jgi:hypothetical protein
VRRGRGDHGAVDGRRVGVEVVTVGRRGLRPRVEASSRREGGGGPDLVGAHLGSSPAQAAAAAEHRGAAPSQELVLLLRRRRCCRGEGRRTNTGWNERRRDASTTTAANVGGGRTHLAGRRCRRGGGGAAPRRRAPAPRPWMMDRRIVVGRRRGIRTGDSKRSFLLNPPAWLYKCTAWQTSECVRNRKLILLPPFWFIRRNKTRHGLPNYTLTTNSSYIIVFVAMNV